MSIELRITEILNRELKGNWPLADHLARVLVTELGFTEFKCGHQRWWSTKFYPTEDA